MKTIQKLALLVGLLLFLVYQIYYDSLGLAAANPNLNLNPTRWLNPTLNPTDNSSRRYAVFSCSTPDARSHRRYDYAFYLPLTAAAWRRIGFQSVVLIIGNQSQWRSSQPLALVLQHLERLEVSVLFVDAPPANRAMLGQTGRLFVFNLERFPAADDDYLITSDADLWPLRLEHFAPKKGRHVTLVHSDCCGKFRFKGSRYRMLPMSHVGARVATWRQIINADRRPANDSASILKYLEDEFGRRVYRRVQFASRQWFYDQVLISVRIQEWIRRRADAAIYRVSDQGYERIDRIDWHPQDLDAASFQKQYDVHLPEELYLPAVWNSIQPVIRLMYADSPLDVAWFDQYVSEFRRRIPRRRS